VSGTVYLSFGLAKRFISQWATSSIKGDLDQSSGSEDDDTDEHLRIHVDNPDKASASAGFSFWFGIKVGNDSATSTGLRGRPFKKTKARTSRNYAA
jgi:hypothetical protein